MDDEPSLRRDPRHAHGVASQLASESLDSYSQEELNARIALLEAEISRVTAHRDRASAHRAAAEAFFRTSPAPDGSPTGS